MAMAPDPTTFALIMDFADTCLDFARIDISESMQGRSLRSVLENNTPEVWQTSMYYRNWEHLSTEHKVGAHYGVRTHKYKLIYYYTEKRKKLGALFYAPSFFHS
ncbi:sulfatase/phosphatase domain-containing protein [Oceanobacillus longus]|uniref:Sulfatase/phosphatase domain-containing protein n=1 Tax=Oceanobacillus longus TaxID=930120 RepID=A0ABV8H039_9BACI